MAGYDLAEGQFENRTLSDDEMWSAFSNLFSSHSKNSSSYKFGFLKAIMDNLYNVDQNLTLTFDQLFGTFTEVYWNLVLKYGIRQQPVSARTNGTYLEQALNTTAEQYAITANIPFESISDEAKIEVCRKVKSKCKINVVGALYGDTKGLFYSFSRKDEWLQINPQMYEFVCKHKLASILRKLMMILLWIIYLQNSIRVPGEKIFLSIEEFFSKNLRMRNVFTAIKNCLMMDKRCMLITLFPEHL